MRQGSHVYIQLTQTQTHSTIGMSESEPPTILLVEAIFNAFWYGIILGKIQLFLLPESGAPLLDSTIRSQCPMPRPIPPTRSQLWRSYQGALGMRAEIRRSRDGLMERSSDASRRDKYNYCGGYTVVAPSLPGCISEGETKDEALANIKEAIALYLEPVDDDLCGIPGVEVVEIAI